MPKIGIHVHGRHMQAKEWESLMMGTGGRLGTLPRLVLEILKRGPENIGLITIGTGASKRDGTVESICMRNHLFENLTSILDIPVIKDHPRIKTEEDILTVSALLIQKVFCDTITKNTAEEIRSAAKLFDEVGCTEIYHVSCASHSPRCHLATLIAKEEGVIPADQTWYPVADQMTYAGTKIGDTVVLEKPHRGDDPTMGADVSVPEVVRGLLTLKPDERLDCLRQLKEIINSY